MDDYFRSTVQARTAAGAARRLSELYGSVALDGALRYREHIVGDKRFSLGRAEFVGEFRGEGESRAVMVVLGGGGYGWEVGDERDSLQSGPVLLQPGVPVRVHAVGVVKRTAVTFDSASLQRTAAAFYGQKARVRFSQARAKTPAFGRSWESLVRLATSHPRLMEEELSRAALLRSLSVMVLESFRLVDASSQRSLDALARLDAYNRAVRFIDDHSSLPITLTDIAEAAGVPEQQLRGVFAASSPDNRTARQYLRAARLSGAHGELATSDPSTGISVGQIAARWGFPSTRAFSRAHRSTYGVAPRTTLTH